MTNLLELNGVYAGYDRGPDILQGVSLGVFPGEVKCIIGPNGAGKSTVLKTISGVLRPRRGEIRYEGQSLVGREAHEILRRGICYLPQERAIFPNMSVLENLRMGVYSLSDAQLAKSRIEELINRFPILGRRLKQLAATLSGGEQQQLVFGRALLLRPRLMLIDEPSLGLAPTLVEQMFELIESFSAMGISILLVEQNAVRGLAAAQTGVVMDLGQVVFEAEAPEVLADSRIRDLFLGKAGK